MPEKYLLINEVAEKLRISRRKLDQIRADKTMDFPKPVPLTTKNVWFESEIDAYMMNMER